VKGSDEPETGLVAVTDALTGRVADADFTMGPGGTTIGTEL
jgi:hypothetical protein